MASAELSASEPVRRMAPLLTNARTSAAASAVTLGRALINDGDDADRCRYTGNIEAVGARPARQFTSDGIGQSWQLHRAHFAMASTRAGLRIRRSIMASGSGPCRAHIAGPASFAARICASRARIALAASTGWPASGYVRAGQTQGLGAEFGFMRPCRSSGRSAKHGFDRPLSSPYTQFLNQGHVIAVDDFVT